MPVKKNETATMIFSLKPFTSFSFLQHLTASFTLISSADFFFLGGWPFKLPKFIGCQYFI